MRRVLLGCGLVTAAGLLANAVHGAFSVLVLVLCGGWPWVDRGVSREGLWRALSVSARGWGWAAGLAAIYVGVPYIGLRVVAGWRVTGSFMAPGWGAFGAAAWELVSMWLPLAVAEEFFFRGYVQEGVLRGRWGERGGRFLRRREVVAAALFCAAHMIGRLSVLHAYAMVNGLILGRLVILSGGSIWPAAALHAFANAANPWLWELVKSNCAY